MYETIFYPRFPNFTGYADKKIGLELERSLDEPFLKTRVTITDLNIFGTLEDDIDKLKIIVSGNEMADDKCLNIAEGILSFPALPLLLSLSIIFLIVNWGEKCK